MKNRIVCLMLSICIVAMVFSSLNFTASADNIDTNCIDTDIVLEQYGLGAIIDEHYTDNCKVDYDKNYPERYNKIINRDISPSCDLSLSNNFPPIRSQGDVGSCVSWATTYYQFGYQVAEKYNWTVNQLRFASQHFSPKFVYNQVNHGCNLGSSFDDNYAVLKSRGAVRYSCFWPNPNASQNPDPDFDPSQYPPNTQAPINPLEYREWCTNIDHQKQGLEYRVSESTANQFAEGSESCPINAPNSPYLSTMKYLLNTNHVLTFLSNYGISENVTAPDISGYSGSKSNLNWEYKVLSSGNHSGEKVCINCQNISGQLYPDKNGNHALSIVGYDDNIWYDYNGNDVQEPAETGALKIANSHGMHYGNNGFMWIMYDALNSSSNFSNLNTSLRIPAITGYKYYYIEVEKSKSDLLAEVTISQKSRIQNVMQAKTIDSQNNQNSLTYVLNQAGNYGFNGESPSTPQTATFVFDYDSLISGNRDWMYYSIYIGDLMVNSPTIIEALSIIDCTGKTVALFSPNFPLDINSITYTYYIGMVGDINNDGYVDVLDATLIQKHINGIITLTSEQLFAADVSGDGNITDTDATQIIQYCVNNITEFSNGAFVNLDP